MATPLPRTDRADVAELLRTRWRPSRSAHRLPHDQAVPARLRRAYIDGHPVDMPTGQALWPRADCEGEWTLLSPTALPMSTRILHYYPRTSSPSSARPSPRATRYNRALSPTADPGKERHEPLPRLG